MSESGEGWCRNPEEVKVIVRNAVKYLLDNGLVEMITEGLTKEGGGLRPTALVKAVIPSAMSAEEGLFVFRELQRSTTCFNLAEDLVLPTLNLH